MPESGLFITLYDEETLQLYLDRGVYGQHMPPEDGDVSPYSNHYRTLADYGCARDGKHVFFFRQRRIYYAGQIRGPHAHGAFYLNGKHSPLGRAADAPLVWDESNRDRYDGVSGDETGLFTVDGDEGRADAVCQPFLIRFEDELGMAGNHILSDELYFELGKYPYPLPSNAMADMGFCTITPGETNHLLDLLEDADKRIEPSSDEDVTLEAEPVPYAPEYGVDQLDEADTESHLEASVVADLSLLPDELQPADGAAVCRQVPISPFKPSNMDAADVCYYGDEFIKHGTIPETIIELKRGKAGKPAGEQVTRYLRWLHQVVPDEAERISMYVFAKAFTRTTFDDAIPERYQDQVQKVTFDGVVQETL